MIYKIAICDDEPKICKILKTIVSNWARKKNKRIRADNKSIQIVFITGYMEYISQGYDVEALHYLLKPIDEDKLFEVLDKACDRISHSEKLLYIESRGEMIQIPIASIRYAEVDRNYITIHTLGGSYSKKQTLTDLEKELNNGETIPLSRGRYEALNQAIINYF